LISRVAPITGLVCSDVIARRALSTALSIKHRSDNLIAIISLGNNLAPWVNNQRMP